jgi:FkbM family methyltransferase
MTTDNIDEQQIPVWIKKGYPSEVLMHWFELENDYFLLRDFDLNENSLVVDIGCFTGVWLKDMYCKYNCNCIGIEPIEKYYLSAKRILVNEKIKLYNFGLTVDADSMHYMNDTGDASTLSNKQTNTFVKLTNLHTFFNSINQPIDVLQINIEGYEYQLLPVLLQTNYLDNVKHLQIQFHNTDKQSVQQMNNIISELQRKFQTKFNYDFVWYGGVKI